MKKILLSMIILLPFYASAEFDSKDGIAINGKIYKSKSSSKFSSPKKCEDYAESKNSSTASTVKGYTYIAKHKKCTLYSNIRSTKKDADAVSGLIT